MGNKNQIRCEGLYLYRPYAGGKQIEVEVVKDEKTGELVVYFNQDFYPVKMKNISEQAIFEPDWR